jgi:putative restriction endonuclease
VVGVNYWWVSQNRTFKQESHGGYLWSPKVRSDGAFHQYYSNMTLVRPGDLVLSFTDAQIAAISRVETVGQESPNPHELKNGEKKYWSDKGWRVHVAYELLPDKARVRPKDFIAELRPFLPEKYAPLSVKGNGPQNMYLTSITEDFVQVVFNHIEATGYNITSRTLSSDVDELRIISEERLETEINQNVFVDTDRLTLTMARVGQGQYREGVIAMEVRCRFTGVDDPKLLRAGHLKPWALCTTHKERLDPDNGLALTPTFDHLVDKGLITWDDFGDVILSPNLGEPDRERLGLVTPINSGAWRPGQLPYVEYHREHVFQQ